MANFAQLPIPDFFDPASAAHMLFEPDLSVLYQKAEVWRHKHDIKPAGSDRFNLHLLIIDAQRDFCFPQGTLYVGGRSGTGAIDDNRRTAEFIYRNLDRITNITTTMDTHFPFQIFYQWFWLDEDGQALNAHTIIVPDGPTLINIDPGGSVLHRNVRPNPAMAPWLCNGNYPWLCDQVQHYCQELKRGGKYALYLWPPHCILGSTGHTLAGIILEARMFHAFARVSQANAEVKGGNVLTENYSVFRPEVLTRFDGGPLAQTNTRFLNTLFTADAMVIIGQAKSHCVKSSGEDLITQIRDKDPDLVRKVYMMTDCTSAVAVPDGQGGFAVDFTSDADAAFQRFADEGVHLVKSTDPIESWPEIRL